MARAAGGGEAIGRLTASPKESGLRNPDQGRWQGGRLADWGRGWLTEVGLGWDRAAVIRFSQRF